MRECGGTSNSRASRYTIPKLELVIGVWGFSGDIEKAKARFGRAQPDRLLTSLAQAVEQIQELVPAQSGITGGDPTVPEPSVFREEDWIPYPSDFSLNIVGGTCDIDFYTGNVIGEGKAERASHVPP